MEAEYDLFHKRVDGVYWWDIVRYDVFDKIYGLSPNGQGQQSNMFAKIVAGIAYKVAHVIGHISFLLSLPKANPEIVFFRCARNTVGDSSRDIISDPIVNLYPGRAFVIDTWQNDRHLPPLLVESSFVRFGNQDLGDIEGIVEKTFGKKLELSSFISKKISVYKREVRVYDSLLRRLRPKCVVFVQNGIQKGLIAASRSLGIPIVELQHGLISYIHKAYSYPDGVDYSLLTTQPDALLLFSEFWSKGYYSPIRHKIVVGNNDLYCERDDYKGNTCLVVSVNIYHEVLRDLVQELSSEMPGWKFIYKLHPNQYADKDTISREFNQHANISVVAAESSVKSLSRQVALFLAIQSTTVYEALQAGKKVLLLRKFNYEMHSDIFGVNNLHLVGDVAEIVNLLSEKDAVEKVPAEVYFEKFQPENVRKLFFNFGVAK